MAPSGGLHERGETERGCRVVDERCTDSGVGHEPGHQIRAGLRIRVRGIRPWGRHGRPGEVAVLALSAGTEGTRPLLALFLVVTLSSSAGDHIGYFLGIRYGQRMRETRLVRRIGQHHWDRAQELCHRYGARAVFLTRLLPVVRTLTPATAGVGSVRYLRFLPASLAGAAMWSALYVSAGTLVSTSCARPRACSPPSCGPCWALRPPSRSRSCGGGAGTAAAARDRGELLGGCGTAQEAVRRLAFRAAGGTGLDGGVTVPGVERAQFHLRTQASVVKRFSSAGSSRLQAPTTATPAGTRIRQALRSSGPEEKRNGTGQ